MTAFTILGMLVFYVWCFQAGYWLGFALDVLLFMKASESHMDAILSIMPHLDPQAPA